jgi:RNA polymerase sigma-70 factor (ECF subfamily)
VARRRLFRRWRSERRGAGAIDFGLTSVTDLGPSPSAVVAGAEEQRLVLLGLQRLPVEMQIALELFYCDAIRGTAVAK